MKTLNFLIMLMAVFVSSLACQLSARQQPALVFPSDTPGLPPLPTHSVTATRSPPVVAVTQTLEEVSASLQLITPSSTASPQPVCTVLLNVRLRKGPGTDFEQVTTLYKDELFVPFAYVPQGRTEGPWVKIYLQNNPERIGWVTANSKVIACNLDITILPLP